MKKITKTIDVKRSEFGLFEPIEKKYGFERANAYFDDLRLNGHYCPEWDYLWITKGSPEYDACLCKLGEIE